MTARIADQAPPDTARRHLLVLAHRQVAHLWMSTEDEVALASVITDRFERDRAFRGLCDAVRRADHDAAETALDLLTGVTR
ncbi:hypothetical protein [Spirillospora sp. NBC_01491]|uniref:hypothetical protein n=1 Tax=Spirillospora sp. NBC_01491 TaxID=2976007 RepID=UPI002E3656C4|nr:hypothetical protein [Spirillospora sp. NBC_01491]